MTEQFQHRIPDYLLDKFPGLARGWCLSWQVGEAETIEASIADRCCVVDTIAYLVTRINELEVPFNDHGQAPGNG